jgi:hypothetical protein
MQKLRARGADVILLADRSATALPAATLVSFESLPSFVSPASTLTISPRGADVSLR